MIFELVCRWGKAQIGMSNPKIVMIQNTPCVVNPITSRDGDLMIQEILRSSGMRDGVFVRIYCDVLSHKEIKGIPKSLEGITLSRDSHLGYHTIQQDLGEFSQEKWERLTTIHKLFSEA